MNERNFKALLKEDSYQVFLFTSVATLPFIFARHPWLVVNRKGVTSRWEVFWEPNRNATSWGHLHKDMYSPIHGIEMFFFPSSFFWKGVRFEGRVEGREDSLAYRMAEFLEASPQTYPYQDRYSLPGPNSNTYAQWVLNNFPECGLRLPWNAFGKGYNGTPA